MSDHSADKEHSSKILLVDDNPIEARLATSLLAQHPIRPAIIWAKSGQEAVAILSEDKDQQISLVLLDIKMPMMDGIETLQQIRSLGLPRRIPVVMFSNSRHPEDVLKSYQHGANGFVQKEADLHEQELSIRKIIDFWLLCNRLP